MINKPVVLVTGASRGLGAATVQWLAKAGAAVTMIARSKIKLTDFSGGGRRLGDEFLAFEADVSDYDACRAAVENTLNRFGRIDAVINNAGIVTPISVISQADPASWRYNIEVNLIGPFNLIRAAVAALRKQGGRVVNISSGAANLALETVSAYCAGKAALNHFTQVLAAEETTLTALTVRPGVVDTEMQAIIRKEGFKAMTAEQLAYYRQLKENGELEPPEIPARSIAWLALYAPTEFSGRFFDYDDPRINRPALDVFGEVIG